MRSWVIAVVGWLVEQCHVTNYTSLYWWSTEYTYSCPCRINFSHEWQTSTWLHSFSHARTIGKSVTFEIYFEFDMLKEPWMLTTLRLSQSHTAWGRLAFWCLKTLTVPGMVEWASAADASPNRSFGFIWAFSLLFRRCYRVLTDCVRIESNWYGLRNGIRDIATALKWIQRSAKMHSTRSYIQSKFLDLGQHNIYFSLMAGSSLTSRARILVSDMLT